MTEHIRWPSDDMSDAEAMDAIYDAVLGLIDDDRYQECNALLAATAPAGIGALAVVGVLSVTLNARSRLPAREQFFLRAAAWLKNARPSDWEQLLAGLE
jgi:hypothetical protein